MIKYVQVIANMKGDIFKIYVLRQKHVKHIFELLASSSRISTSRDIEKDSAWGFKMTAYGLHKIQNC